MKKITAADPESRSADLLADNVDKLRELFPQAFTEGKVDFLVLRELLGDAVEEREERYGLNWHGKAQARRLALTPSTGTLRPVKEESVDWDTTQNLIIEGDNLEVLKLLQKSYAGKVKLIYIDPPYNTGSDFVYPDDYRDTMASYLRRTDQTNEEGFGRSTNTESSGRFHTNWLNMMLPRLNLARNLLRQDGLVFISIDEHEFANLRLLCDEVFGSERFVAVFKWNKTSKAPTLSKRVRSKFEYVFCYGRGPDVQLRGPKSYNTAAPLFNSGNPRSRRSFQPGSLRLHFEDGTYEAGIYGRAEKAVELHTDLIVSDGVNAHAVDISGRFKWSQATIEDHLAAGRQLFFKTSSFTTMYYSLELGEDKFIAPSDLLSKDECGVLKNDDGFAELKALFDGAVVFDYPKPVSLPQKLVEMANDPGGLVLDFFAGSAPTAHAVMAQNAQDNGNRRFVMVQLPEPTGRDDFPTIADITKERVRRAAKQLRQVNPSLATTQDLGFRVFKLDSTNLRPWDPTPTDLQTQLGEHVDHIKPDRTEDDLLYEVLLKLGIDLSVPIETRTIAGFEVHNIGAGQLLACFGTPIRRDDATPLARGITAWHNESRPEAADAAASTATLLFRDAAFEDDVAKQNLVHALEQAGLTNVRSL